MQRIAITGAMCSGKTTLAKKLADYYHGNYVPDAGRLYFERFPSANRGSTQTNQEIAQEYLRLSRVALDPDVKYVFHDNFILSPVAHLTAFGRRQQAESLLTEFKNEISAFDLYVILDPRDIPYKDDAVRIEGPIVLCWRHPQQKFDPKLAAIPQIQDNYLVRHLLSTPLHSKGFG